MNTSINSHFVIGLKQGVTIEFAVKDTPSTLNLFLDVHRVVKVLEVRLATCRCYFLYRWVLYIPVTGGNIENLDVNIFTRFDLARIALFAHVSVIFLEFITCLLVSPTHSYNR
jgi:hypothetical protein